MHLVFREAKEAQDVTVLLSGEGADEVFGGYEWYSVGYRRDTLRRIPGLRLAGSLLPGRRAAVLDRVLHPEYLLAANATTPPGALGNLGVAGIAPVEARRDLWPRGAAGADGLFVYDQRTYLPPLLQRQDRMSMAAGLEARVPFLDQFLVEWANALPLRTKLPQGARKRLLKDIAEPWLPASIIHRRKVGFAMPLGDWLRTGGYLSERVQGLRSGDSFVRRFVRPGAVDRLIHEHQERQADHTGILWSLLSLEVWADTFLGSHVRGVVLPGAATLNPVVLAGPA